MRPSLSKAGFTLVEIMLVVVTIGLLAALATPPFRRVREETRKVTCQNGQRLVRDAVDEWASAHTFPSGSPTRPDEVLAYIKGGRQPACPEGNRPILVPARVGDPVRCPAGLASHAVLEEKEPDSRKPETGIPFQSN